jgi:hypothetical protein
MTNASDGHHDSVVHGVWQAVIGDSLGRTIFLGALVFFGLTWRIGAMVPEVNTVASTLAAVGDGHLYIDHSSLTAGPSTVPGLHTDGTRIYARSYGQALLALPFLWTLSVASAVVGIGAVLIGSWSIVLLWFAVSLGDVIGRRESALRIGLVVSSLLLAGNLYLARPVPTTLLPVVATQLATMVSAALIAVIVYRLVTRAEGRLLGAVTGIAVVVATPVGFWGTIPVHNSIAALLAALTLYTFYRSRAEAGQLARRFRALSYAWGGIATWIQPGEGAVLLLSVGLVDLLVTTRGTVRQLLMPGVVVSLSLVPLVLINTMTTGNPLLLPRTLPEYTGGNPMNGIPGERQNHQEMVTLVVELMRHGFGRLTRTIQSATELSQLYKVFVRSQFSSTPITPLSLGGVDINLNGVPTNLSALESMPILGALLSVPATLFGERERDTRADPEQATDALGVVYLSLVVLLYLPVIPTNDSITLRQLLPVYVVCLYLLARFDIVSQTVRAEWRVLYRTYLGSLLVGGILFLSVLPAMVEIPTQALRINAVLAFATAAMLLYWGTLQVHYGGYRRMGASILGLAGAVTSLFILLSAFSYFNYTNRYAIPVFRLLAEVRFF